MYSLWRYVLHISVEIELLFIWMYSLYISPMTIFFLISISKLASVLSWNLFNGGLKLNKWLSYDCMATARQLPGDYMTAWWLYLWLPGDCTTAWCLPKLICICQKWMFLTKRTKQNKKCGHMKLSLPAELKVSKSQKHFFLKLHFAHKTNEVLDKILP